MWMTIINHHNQWEAQIQWQDHLLITNKQNYSPRKADILNIKSISETASLHNVLNLHFWWPSILDCNGTVRTTGQNQMSCNGNNGKMSEQRNVSQEVRLLINMLLLLCYRFILYTLCLECASWEPHHNFLPPYLMWGFLLVNVGHRSTNRVTDSVVLCSLFKNDETQHILNVSPSNKYFLLLNIRKQIFNI